MTSSSRHGEGRSLSFLLVGTNRQRIVLTCNTFNLHDCIQGLCTKLCFDRPLVLTPRCHNQPSMLYMQFPCESQVHTEELSHCVDILRQLNVPPLVACILPGVTIVSGALISCNVSSYTLLLPIYLGRPLMWPSIAGTLAHTVA